MTNAETLWSVLSQDATLGAIVGTGDDAKIYPLRVPEEVEGPYVTYHSLATEAYNKLSSAPQVDRTEFEIAVVSTSYDEALAGIQAIRDALGTEYGYMDTMGDEFFSSTREFRVWIHWSLTG
jgi:hypothetical protein